MVIQQRDTGRLENMDISDLEIGLRAYLVYLNLELEH